MGRLIDPFIVVVSRHDVERSHTADTLVALERWLDTAAHPHDVRGCLRLAFHGYDDDPRELWMIAEVRTFVSALDRAFPYWFYVADLQSSLLMVMACCVCRVSSPRPGATALHPDDFEQFLRRHFEALQRLADRWSIGDREPDVVSDEIVAYFQRTRILN